ncbi:MAG TPA: nuclear transport factor 2 family protein [Stellaceae bacterium]
MSDASAADLAARVQRLEAMEAIRQVMGDYVLAADDRHGYSVNVERTMRLFAQDGVWDGGTRYGRHEGGSAVRNYLLRGRAGIDWSLHHLSNPSIDVTADGQLAHGRWYLVEMARMRKGESDETEIVWLGGLYDADFVREDGAWKFKQLKFDCQIILGADGRVISAPAQSESKT